MSTNEILFGVIAWAAIVEINSLFAKRALKTLGAEDRAKFSDPSPRRQVLNLVTILIVGVIFFYGLKAWPWSDVTLVWTLLLLFVLNSISDLFFSYRALKKSSMPKHYVSNVLIRSVIYYGAQAMVVVILAVRYLSR